MIPTDELKALAEDALARAGKATGKAWRHGVHSFRDFVTDDAILLIDDLKPNDAKFIAHARTDVPALAQAVLDLIGENENLRWKLEKIWFEAREVGEES